MNPVHTAPSYLQAKHSPTSRRMKLETTKQNAGSSGWSFCCPSWWHPVSVLTAHSRLSWMRFIAGFLVCPDKCGTVNFVFNNWQLRVVSWGGVRLSPLGTSANIWPIVPGPDNRWWVWSSRWNENWQGKPKYSEKTCTVPLCPPQIPHDLTWDRTRVAAVGSRRLTAWAMARPSTEGMSCLE
jgi:hypothetical protein